MNGGGKKEPSYVKQLTLFRRRMVLMSRRGSRAVSVTRATGYAPPPIRCRLLLSPGVSPSPGFSFGVLARDRCSLVVLAEFLGVAAWEILVRDRLD